MYYQVGLVTAPRSFGLGSQHSFRRMSLITTLLSAGHSPPPQAGDLHFVAAILPPHTISGPLTPNLLVKQGIRKVILKKKQL